MNLLEPYEEAITCGELVDDNEQRDILLILEKIGHDLMRSSRHFPWYKRKSPTGLYLYGDVGVGKTFMMDLFFKHLPIKKKLRFHFHHFMQQIDSQLRLYQGNKNPLLKIAHDLKKRTRILCFDEFMVQDVAHAMILGQLLEVLLAQDLVMAFTSNIAPAHLYWSGVHRDRFLPAIAAIQSHCEIIRLVNKRDYRLRSEVTLQTYLYPLDEENSKLLVGQFCQLEPYYRSNEYINIQNREVLFRMCGEKAIAFDFKVICNLPRSQLDYLELAERFSTIVVSNVPVLREHDSVYVVLFMHLVDVLYDNGISLILSAEVSLEQLYTQGELVPVFQRTYSRLQEMQTANYTHSHRHWIIKGQHI